MRVVSAASVSVGSVSVSVAGETATVGAQGAEAVRQVARDGFAVLDEVHHAGDDRAVADIDLDGQLDPVIVDRAAGS